MGKLKAGSGAVQVLLQIDDDVCSFRARRMIVGEQQWRSAAPRCAPRPFHVGADVTIAPPMRTQVV